MDLKYRRIIYITFFAAFFLVGAWLTLWSQGYHYDFLNKKIESTGAISIITKPTGATVWLDGKQQAATTPLSIKNLKAGNYTVTVTLPGWQTWEKKLLVYDRQVVRVNNIKLWPEATTGKILNGANHSYSLISPNRQTMIYTKTVKNNFELWLLNLTSAESVRLDSSPLDQKIVYFEWSPSNRQLLTKTMAGQWFIYNLTSNQEKSVNIPSDINIQNIHWSTNDQDQLYFSSEKELYEFDLESDSAKVIWQAPIIDFRSHQNLIYAMVKQNGVGQIIKILNPRNLQVVPLPEDIPLSSDFKFLDNNNDWLPLLDSNRHLLYLLNSPLTSLRPIIKLPSVTNIDWSFDNKRLLLNNHFEIWQYFPQEDKLDLLYRISSPIGRARWYDDHYILFSTNTNIEVLELDPEFEQQKWTIANQAKTITDFYLTKTKELVTLQTDNGLSRLPIEDLHLPDERPID